MVSYFPSESLILFQGEGETELSIDIMSFLSVDKSPYSLVYSPDKIRRINGKSFEPLDRNELFVEKDIGSEYKEVYRIGLPFPIFLGGVIDGVFWENNRSVYFKFCENLECRYYQTSIIDLD